MVQRVVVSYTDDLDGKSFQEDEGRQVVFGLDGKTWEIDLREENVKRLTEALAPFIAAARVDDQTRASVTNIRRGSTRARTAELREVRRWASEHGHYVNPRGRVPRWLQNAYDEAHSSSTKPESTGA